MILYAVKSKYGYLRKIENAKPSEVSMNKASVFQKIEDAQKLRDVFGSGIVCELTLTEKKTDF